MGKKQNKKKILKISIYLLLFFLFFSIFYYFNINNIKNNFIKEKEKKEKKTPIQKNKEANNNIFKKEEISRVVKENKRNTNEEVKKERTYLEMYNEFEKKNNNLTYKDFYIYKKPIIDKYIQKKAEQRGYQKRKIAEEKNLIKFEDIYISKDAFKYFNKLKKEFEKNKLRVRFLSGFRTVESQRNIFLRKMGKKIDIKLLEKGYYDKKIDKILSVSSIPGYSKHHSGYAFDISCGNNNLNNNFIKTKCYKWISKNNFENIKKIGFIPSYPKFSEKQGPNFESWEYLWIGVENIK